MTRKLKQVVGLRQAVMGMCVLRHVQANDALQGATRNHNGVAHKQANLGGRNLDHRARLAKAIQVDSNAVFAALGHLSTELSKAVPRVAHIVQVGGHVKLNEVFAHAAVHEQRTALWIQIQDADGNHVDGLNRRERRDVFLTVTDIHQKRGDGAEQEERGIRDRNRSPHRAHDVNRRRRRGSNEQQFNQHDGAAIMHHKDHAIGGNRGVGPQ